MVASGKTLGQVRGVRRDVGRAVAARGARRRRMLESCILAVVLDGGCKVEWLGLVCLKLASEDWREESWRRESWWWMSG